MRLKMLPTSKKTLVEHLEKMIDDHIEIPGSFHHVFSIRVRDAVCLDISTRMDHEQWRSRMDHEQII